MFTFKNKKTFQFANNNNKFNISRFASLEIKEIFIFPNYIIINVPGGRAYIQNDRSKRITLSPFIGWSEVVEPAFDIVIYFSQYRTI